MKFALDYDGTYTADRVLWKAFVKNALARGHEVTFVTFRLEQGGVRGDGIVQDNVDIKKSAERMGIPIVFSCGKPKRECYDADVWIDDHPETVTMNYEQCKSSGLFLPEAKYESK